ncbi:MAG TPA: RHS repeat-associated core domain-containing protein [Pseudomonas sp.]|uniref:RHS repeat domain-containing protein n=1 Tax=Pseudomonas sp. TaxID=306 RepID=UPI002C03FE19|nr:RHS repeat-associated core domain-containing protein [Pseudomonas sp.]HWH86971.1 RHS repeat-associated core domain-containing protein [Pseudomonas sp.]
MNAATHWHTPALSVIDGRGLAVRQVAYMRCEGVIKALVNRQQHDAAGRPVTQRDPRLAMPNLTTVHDLGGAVLKTDSVDAGWRLSLPGLAGEPRQRWDERVNHWRMAFDDQLRVLTVEENGQAEVEVFTYADASADTGHNRCGQLLEQKDRSGTLRTDSYALTGQPLTETRTFGDDQAFTSRRVFSPLGAVLEQTDAGGHRQQSRYGRAGQLRQVRLWVKGQPDWQPVLYDAQYNAADQIIEQRAGNGVCSQWTYDLADGRLRTQCSRKDVGPPLQNFEYFYDPVGNITCIKDHTFQPTWFANQQVDGHREFCYDEQYRLVYATGYDDGPPSDIPGLPQPTDPKNRLNYTQTYTYDDGGNLEKRVHVRAGASHTLQMCTDRHSNRSVRWQPNDPEPDFDSLFDPHGNQLHLHPGRPMQWNTRDELHSVTLVHRENAPDDIEHYTYSQGARVLKRHEWHAGATVHFHQVRYLPGLEIRTRDNGEELHVISVGSARCLHWVQKPPADIANNQLRYSLEDHLGSCTMELDQLARIISEEGYYPFGATAWLLAEFFIEVSYRFWRYSGKEMDCSGAYYYGARYYAPWLQRWVSPDAEQADGLNLYAFVGNNPIRFVDPDGNKRAEGVIMLYSAFVSAVGEHSEEVLGQLHSIIHSDVAVNMMVNMAGEGIRGLIGYEGGSLGGGQFDILLPALKVEPNVLKPSGLIGGNIGGDVAGAMLEPLANQVDLRVGPLIPQTSQMSVSAIDERLGIAEPVKEINSWEDFKSEVVHPVLNSVFNPLFLMNRVVGSVIGGISGALNMGSRAQEAQDIKNRLDPVKIEKIEKMLSDWKAAIEQRSAWAENAFDAVGVDRVSPANVLPNANGNTSSETLAVITRSGLRQKTRAVLANISRAQAGLAHYKEMGTTDNLYMARQRHVASKKPAHPLVAKFKYGR